MPQKLRMFLDGFVMEGGFINENYITEFERERLQFNVYGGLEDISAE